MGRLGQLATVGAATGAAGVAYGTLVEPRWYRLRHVPLTGAATDGRRPVRVLHLSDLHVVPSDTRKCAFVRALADRVDYDLVAVTGDVLGAHDTEDAAADLLAHLTAGGVPGVAVLGSNDVYGPTFKNPARYFVTPESRVYGEPLDTRRLAAGLTTAGYTLLHGEAAVLDTPAGPVGVGGSWDPHLFGTAELPDPGVVTPAGDGVVARVGLVHAPYRAALDVLVAAGHRLLLAGHTHGGQVRLPGVGALVGNCDLPLDQVRGASRYAGAWLHVSPGLGTSRYAPFRFACRPEATLLELR